MVFKFYMHSMVFNSSLRGLSVVKAELSRLRPRADNTLVLKTKNDQNPALRTNEMIESFIALIPDMIFISCAPPSLLQDTTKCVSILEKNVLAASVVERIHETTWPCQDITQHKLLDLIEC